MNTRRYRLRILGLPDAPGQIRVSTLCSVMDALLLVAERSTRLLAEGKGTGSGPRPSWLRATLDFTFVGLGSGSTLLDLKAPCLKETAGSHLRQGHFWRDPVNPDDTALDLAALAIKEAQSGSPTGSRYDNSVLEAIQELGKAAGFSGVRYEMESNDEKGNGFVLDEQICQGIPLPEDSIPNPRAYVVSGILDQITHKDEGHFRLVFKEGENLVGRVDPECLEVECLRPHWGMAITIQGIVSFRSDGEAKSILARRINARAKGDGVFEKLPKQGKLIDADLERKSQAFDPMIIVGKWPGDESIEELLAMLD